MKYNLKRPKASKHLFMVVAAILLVLLIAGVAFMRKVYFDSLKPRSHLETTQPITIPTGSSVQEIAGLLEENKIIRKSWAFEWYVRNSDVREKLQAGTYALKPSLSVQEIVDILTQGNISRDLVTILPAKRIDELRAGLINAGFDMGEVDLALDPAQYEGHPALVDKPKEASLEGYLYPESFERTGDTKPTTIITASLDQMQKYLTPELRAGIVAQGLTVHQGVILASIVEQEVTTSEDRAKASQVFLRRLREGIALESDATASYGAVLAGEEAIPGYSSAYNTYQNKGLTPGPISNVTKSSLEAVAYPASTNFLFFVAGHDCVTRFSTTVNEHDALKREHGIGCKSRN
jgi:UPF0755 protein